MSSGPRDRQRRAWALARSRGADGVLAADATTVTWLTGYAAPIENGPSPFAPSPLVIITPEEECYLVVAADTVADAQVEDCHLETYQGYVNGPMDPHGNLVAVVRRLAGGWKVAIEARASTAAITQDLNWVDLSQELAWARLVKEADEIARLKAAISLCDAGQQAVRVAAVPGISELDIWDAARLAMERLAEAPIPVLADVISGPRTALVGGPPTNRVLRAGDLVLIDLVPRRRGYWGDSCATLCLGEPSTEIQKRQRKIREALRRAVEAIRPGMLAGQLDEIVRGSLRYPHHSGHGLGTSYHEEPRIVPGSHVVLEAGMVMALEPALYEDGVGIRLEQVLAVTSDGCEVLSRHALEL